MQTSTRKSYSELSSGIRYAQSLYEADFGDVYVREQLIKKGFTAEEAEWIMLSAEVENVVHRKKVSLVIAIVMGIAWGIIIGIYVWSSATPDDIRRMKENAPFVIDVRHIGITLVLFLGGLANFIRSYFQVKKAKRKLDALTIRITH
jgi:hypothetical protein